MLRPFGPSIFKVKIPDVIINSLNEYIDNVVKDNEKSSKLNYGESLVGDVTQEFKLEENFFLAYSPERENPGDKNYGFKNTPKVVSGLGSSGRRHP